jgi:hypothetical protein
LFEIARRDLVFRYWSKEIARRDLIISALNKRNRQMGFQVDEGRQMGPHISCWLKGIARLGFQVD